MGFFDFGATKEYRTQLYFHDDGSFEFRKLPLKDACLVIERDNKAERAWPDFFTALMRFDGYKNIRADKVILGFSRDIILDPFNKIPELDDSKTKSGGKPRMNTADVKKFTSKIAESQRYKIMSKPGSMLLLDKITLFLGCNLTLMVIGLLIVIARARA